MILVARREHDLEMSSRYYLKTTEELRRLPKKVFDLSEKAPRFPQFAGTVKPYVSVGFVNGRILDYRTCAVSVDESDASSHLPRAAMWLTRSTLRSPNEGQDALAC